MFGMEQALGMAAMKMMPMLPLVVLVPAAVLMYFYLVWDAKKSDLKDTQIGLKTALHSIALLGVVLAAGGASSVLWYLFAKMGGAKGVGSELIKAGMGSLIAGAGAFGAAFALLPRTNLKEFGKATRVTIGIVAILFAMAAFASADALFTGVFSSARWEFNSMYLAGLAVYGGLGFGAIMRLGQMSGWTAPPPRAPGFPQGFPPQQGGYPPQQGFPPQQGGGYPPQGGGYPPQQGGGYPPQQGGGLPPPSGGYPPGGYPPR